MNYAIIENGVVSNLIWLHPGNAAEFPAAVPLGDKPVGIGDCYENGAFTRGGNPVRSAQEELTEARDIIAELDAAIVELEYANILLELGV